MNVSTGVSGHWRHRASRQIITAVEGGYFCDLIESSCHISMYAYVAQMVYYVQWSEWINKSYAGFFGSNPASACIHCN